MTRDEFKEIHEAWAELKTISDEIDALNAEEARSPFCTTAPPTASAQ